GRVGTVRKVLDHTWEDVDEFLEAYECAWRTGTTPELASFLPEREHPQYLEVLLELIRVDQELRWESSQPLEIGRYLERYPEISSQESLSAQLAFEEYRLRRQAGEPVSAAEYATRYGICTSTWIESGPSGKSGTFPSVTRVLPQLGKSPRQVLD